MCSDNFYTPKTFYIPKTLSEAWQKSPKLQTTPFYRLKDGIADMHEVHIYSSFS